MTWKSVRVTGVAARGACQLTTIQVSIKDGVLAVTGERKYEKETEGKVHRIERRYGRFTRSFRLPENADENAVEAHAKEGVLHLVVAKREEVKPKAIEIKVR